MDAPMFAIEQITGAGSTSFCGMQIAALPTLLKSQILALYKIAKEECADGTWEDIEPILASFWAEAHPPPDPKWEEVAPYIRAACSQLRTQNPVLQNQTLPRRF
jgi:hypothetical protein